MPIVDEELMALARKRLLHRAAALRAVKLGPTVETDFMLSELRQGFADYGIGDWLSGERWPYPKKQPALYVIRLADAASVSRLMQEFPARPARDFAAPRANASTGNSATLYVGSTEDVKKRLREHLWQGHRLTYALHLGRWCKETEGPVFVSVQPILDSDERQVRQDLEDFVWHQLKPKLGKSGGR